MLADAGGQDGFAAGQLVEHLDDHLRQDDFVLRAVEMILHVLRFQHLIGHAIAKRRLGFPLGDLLLPCGEFFLQWPLADHVGQLLERVANLAHHRQGDLAVFVDLRRVDVDVDNGAVLAEFLDLAGHAVVKPHAKGKQQVGALGHLLRVALGILLELAADGPVGIGRAVHAEPAQRQLVRLRERAHAHDRAGDRDAGRCDQAAQRVAGVGADDAAANVKQWPVAFLDQSNDLVELEFACLEALGVEPGDVHLVGEQYLRAGLLDVFRHVDDHRAGPAACGDLERLLHHGRDFVDVGDEVAVFHHRQGHPEKVGLLKSALADHCLRHLAGDGDERDRIHERVGDAGDEVGGAGAAGGHADTGPAGGAGIALGRERAALLVARQDGADLLGSGQRLVKLHARAAGVGEDRVHALALECADEDLTADHARADLALGLG